MSNHICIIPTNFVNARSGNVSYGVRVYNDHECVYDNSWMGIPVNDLDILRETIISANNAISNLLDYLKKQKQGCEIDETWYDWDEIKSVFI